MGFGAADEAYAKVVSKRLHGWWSTGAEANDIAGLRPRG